MSNGDQRFYRASVIVASVLVIGAAWQAMEIRGVTVRIDAEKAEYHRREVSAYRRIDAAKRAERLAAAKLRFALTDRHQARREQVARQMEVDEIMRKDPRMRALRLKEYRVYLSTGLHQTAMEALALSPEKEAQFKDLLMEKVAKQMEAMQRLPPGDYPRADAEAEAKLTSDADALLGPGGYGKYQMYMRQAGIADDMENGLGLDLSMAGAPLTPTQTDSLARIAFEETQKPGVGSQRKDPTGLSETEKAILASASGVLSTDQVAALKASYLENANSFLLRQKIVADARVAGEIVPGEMGWIELYGDGSTDEIPFWLRAGTGK